MAKEKNKNTNTKSTDVKPTEDTKQEKHKVKFKSTLFTYDFRFNSGDITELTPEQYEIAKKYNSIEDYNG